MKVLIDNSPLLGTKTGIGYYVANICRGLEGYEDVELSYLHDPRGAPLRRMVRSVTSPLKSAMQNLYPRRAAAFAYDLLMSPWSLYSAGQLGRNILREIDIYHETTHVVSFDKRKGSARLVANVHDLSPLIHPHWHLETHVNDVVRTFKNLLEADHIITDSQYIKEELCSLYNVERTRVTSVPIATAASYSVLPDKDGVRQFISEHYTSKEYLLYVGTVEPRKNLNTLFRAFRIIRDKYDLSLLVVGGLGWLYEDVVALPFQLGIGADVRFTGYVDEGHLEHLYNGALMFIYPSFYEGFGIPPLEAMSCGTPVITSNRSSLPEVVGNAAETFNPENVEELASIIERLVTSDSSRQMLVEKGLLRSRAFSWERSVRELYNVYKNVL